MNKIQCCRLIRQYDARRKSLYVGKRHGTMLQICHAPVPFTCSHGSLVKLWQHRSPQNEGSKLCQNILLIALIFVRAMRAIGNVDSTPHDLINVFIIVTIIIDILLHDSAVGLLRIHVTNVTVHIVFTHQILSIVVIIFNLARYSFTAESLPRAGCFFYPQIIIHCCCYCYL